MFVCADELEFCIPVSAPYSALADWKFKVKLQPGTERRGKSVKRCLALFTNNSDATEREKLLLKCVQQNELLQTMLSDVKVSAPGLGKIGFRGKGKKKSKRK